MLTFEILFNVLPNNSLSVVLPQLPVIAIMFVSILFLKIFETFVKNFKVFFTLICRLLLNLFCILFTTANEAFLLKDWVTNLFPSFFFPLIAKKISFLVTS